MWGQDKINYLLQFSIDISGRNTMMKEVGKAQSSTSARSCMYTSLIYMSLTGPDAAFFMKLHGKLVESVYACNLPCLHVHLGFYKWKPYVFLI